LEASSDASFVRVIIYVVAAVLLSTVAGALKAAQRLNSEIDQINRGDHRIPRMKAGEALLGAAIVIGAIFAAVYYMQTNHGIVRVEVNDPSLQVSINDQHITTQDGDGKTLTIRPSEQTLIVRNDDADFEFETDRFQIRRGDEINFKVDYRNGEIVVRKDYQTFARAHLLVGHWRGKIDADEEIRLTFNANGTFEIVRLNPATPQRIQNRTTGKYVANFSAFPAQFIFDGTIIYPAIDPPSEPPPTSNELEGASPTMEGAERERAVKRKFVAMVDLADANTLYISDLFATARRRMFGQEELVMHRQGVKKDVDASQREPAEAATTSSDGAAAAGKLHRSPEQTRQRMRDDSSRPPSILHGQIPVVCGLGQSNVASFKRSKKTPRLGDAAPNG
jgi:hypothetical protein